MTIIPQHGWMYVELKGWYKKLQSDTVKLLDATPEPLDVVTAEVLAVEPDPNDDNAHGYMVGTVVLARYLAFVSVEVTETAIEPKEVIVKGLMRSQDVMAVLGEEVTDTVVN